MLIAAGVLAARSAAADERGAAQALLHDMRKLVSAQETTGWLIDRYEIESLMPDGIYSTCQVTPAGRARALAAAEHTIARLGGPLEQAFAERGSIDELGELVSATRVRDLLAEAIERAPRDCPPWLRGDDSFRGVQTDAERFTLNLELGGVLVAQRSEGRNSIGGGGAGRLLLGYGLDHTHSVLLGGELGGNALFRRGDQATQFPVQLQLAAPLVWRAHHGTFLHDLELAPLFHFTDETELVPSYGVRVGGLLGISTFRIHNIMPWAGVGLSFEYLFANDHRSQIVAMKGGGRVGFDWDF